MTARATIAEAVHFSCPIRMANDLTDTGERKNLSADAMAE
jgi:hypothetical protein